MNRRPIVALVCDAIHPYSHGGRELRYYELARRLSSNFDVQIYSMHWWQGPREYKDGGVTFHAISKNIPMYKNNRRSIWQAIIFASACLRLLGCDFDILEADHMPYIHVFVLRIVATIKRRPFVVTWHEVWGRPYWTGYLGWLGNIAWAIEQLAMRAPNSIIAASPQTSERLCSSLGKQACVVVVPNGIDLETIDQIPAAPECCDIVTVSRLLDHKRIDMLLNALALLHRRGLHATCRIIGDGPEKDALHEQARNLGIADEVQFQHEVDEQKEVYASLKASRVFALPSSREGFGIAALEALGCGVAVVTTSAPDNLAQHLVRKSRRGLVCRPTAEDLASAIEVLLVDAESTALSNTRDQWIASYDWELMSRKVAALYTQLLFSRTMGQLSGRQ